MVPGLAARANAMMMTPQSEWAAVAAESSDGPAIRYVAILALIPAMARFVGGWLIGGYTPFLAALVGAMAAYALSLVLLFTVALVVDMLAPKFDAKRGYSQALRLTAYASTPVWLAGLFLLVPGASFLMVLGLYGFYVMRTGLPVLMQAPQQKTLRYVLAVAVLAVALDLAVRLLLIAVIGTARS